MKYYYPILAGVSFVLLWLKFFFWPDANDWLLLIFTLGLCVLAAIDSLDEFFIGLKGVAGKTRKIEKIASEVKQIYRDMLNGRIEAVNGQTFLSHCLWPDLEIESILAKAKEHGLDESDFPALSNHKKRICRMYARHILDVNPPAKYTEELKISVHNLFNEESFPSPDEVRSFLQHHNLLSSIQEERLAMYDYYREKGSHRDPKAFKASDLWHIDD